METIDRNQFSRFFTKEVDAMIPLIEPTLYIDPQTQPPAAFCPVCGGALYAPSLRCIRCERNTP